MPLPAGFCAFYHTIVISPAALDFGLIYLVPLRATAS